MLPCGSYQVVDLWKGRLILCRKGAFHDPPTDYRDAISDCLGLRGRTRSTGSRHQNTVEGLSDADAVRASTGLGVSLADFKNEYGGLTFEYAQLNDGRDRWMASDVEIGVLVEVIGPERSLDQATMIVSMEIDSLSVTMLLATFLLTAAPDWDDGMDWVSDHIEESIGQKITTKDGDLTAEISVSSELGLLTLTIAGS